MISTQPLRCLPPEWSAQSGVMLTWPHEHSDWQPLLGEVEPVYVDLARLISRHEQVLIACYDDRHRAHINRLLTQAGLDSTQLKLYIAPSNDTWARDHGPICVLEDHQPLLLDFIFNGWGQKFPAELDNRISRCLHDAGAFNKLFLKTIDMVLEGGSIEVDGAGTLLTTSRCLLSPKRNPSMNKAQIESELKTLFGVQQILWLNHGYLAGDDTDSHIDTLARFCDTRTIAYVKCTDTRDEHFVELNNMERELNSMRNIHGEPYRMMPLPMPQAKYNPAGQRMPATYANFLIINNAVLVPTYDDPADHEALERLADCFVDRNVYGINALPLIEQFGSVHCITMQLPKGVLQAVNT